MLDYVCNYKLKYMFDHSLAILIGGDDQLQQI